MRRARFFLLLGILGFVALAVLCAAVPSHAAERDYQLPWCAERGGTVEVVMSDGTRADCVTATHAIEFDFAPKWAEAIGQALHYAALTGKKPGIVLIVGPDDGRYLERLRATIAAHCLRIDVWEVNK